MKINPSLFCLLILLIHSCSGSKKETDETGVINKTLNEYIEVVVRNDFEALTEFTYPELFKEFSKEEMIRDAKSGMNNNDYEVTVNSIYIDSISDVYISGLNKYAMAKTRTDGSFLIKGGELNDSVSRNKIYNHFCSGFKEKFGNANVKCDNLKKKVNVIMINSAYLIYDNKYKKWFILADTNADNIKKFVPAEIRNKFGE